MACAGAACDRLAALFELLLDVLSLSRVAFDWMRSLTDVPLTSLSRSSASGVTSDHPIAGIALDFAPVACQTHETDMIRKAAVVV